jgi:hypothetical protein
VIKQSLTPIEIMLTSFHYIIDDCMIDNPKCVHDATTEEDKVKCANEISTLKQAVHRKVFDEFNRKPLKKDLNRETTDDLFLDDILQTSNGQTLGRKIDLIKATRKWLGIKATSLSHSLLEEEVIRRRVTDASGSIRSSFEKGIELSKLVETKVMNNKRNHIPGISTSSELWNHIGLLIDDESNGGKTLVEKYLHLVGNYKLFHYLRDQYIHSLCHLKSTNYRKNIVLNGEYNNNRNALNAKVLLNEKKCVNSETQSIVNTPTGMGGKDRSIYPSSATDHDDQSGISASGLYTVEGDVHSILFNEANNQACDMCIGSVSNDLSKNSPLIQSTSGWDQETLSSSTLYCESLDTNIKAVMCKVIVEHLIVIINQRLYHTIGMKPSLQMKTLKESL